MRYAWDPRKASSNAEKHHVLFEEAVTVFDDPMTVLIDDLDHGEGRYVAVGESEQQRVLFVVHIEVSEEETRILSARRATSHERRQYEEGD